MTRDWTQGDELFLFTGSRFTFLIGLGFSVKHTSEETHYASREVRWVIGRRRDGRPPTQRLYSVRDGRELVSPYTMLQYSMEDFDLQWRNIAALQEPMLPVFGSIRTGGLLLSRNRRVFTDTKWTSNGDLIKAAAMLDEWAEKRRREGGAPSQLQAHAYLQSLKLRPAAEHLLR